MDRENEQPREWNAKYWDIIDDLYWNPKYLGLKSIPRKKWQISGERVSLALADIANTSGPLYSRSRKSDDLRDHLRHQEEILNHVFNLALWLGFVHRSTPMGILEFQNGLHLERKIGAV